MRNRRNLIFSVALAFALLMRVLDWYATLEGMWETGNILAEGNNAALWVLMQYGPTWTSALVFEVLFLLPSWWLILTLATKIDKKIGTLFLVSSGLLSFKWGFLANIATVGGINPEWIIVAEMTYWQIWWHYGSKGALAILALELSPAVLLVELHRVISRNWRKWWKHISSLVRQPERTLNPQENI